MQQAKKFGAFAGVFTPSILTILGVIMYMRLGWVVGEAGFYGSVAIILIAHIISFTTGLSISSIATDKKIKTGGIYYVLSRSLGLPMGGAIGIALAVGMALSISLYIVGFVESFFGVNEIQSVLGELNINKIRVTGSIVLISLTIIAFISTSLAIKTQFYIFIAIILSLLSIGFGVGLYFDFSVSEAILTKASESTSFEYVFSIFFPAVTGFTAGVAMSGDLKDPKKDIPKGTMISIGLGFIVYIVLAFVFAFFLDRKLLVTDFNFITKVSLIPFLVILGIWGATLSSALGGILGGPRILQAIAQDKIIPKFLGKGYGASSEPRVALIFIFIISEAGILIGDLNVIAGVVSMFYLASYGFINLAFFLESLASTDFRPSFKIPKVVGLIGAIASFLVMLKLDIVAMFAAFFIMGVIYFLLKRQQLNLDLGDVWQSVWNTIIRTALFKMNRKNIEQRNWRPNIILFSGSTERRKYLLEFGKAVVGKYGILSNFDLIENKDSKVLFPKHKQAIKEEDDSSEGVFTRQKTCRDIYEGIETIASTYGFSGVEPNTVVMGWARHTLQPKRFVSMLQSLFELDLNIVMIDYDPRYGFGKHQLIDIWWRGEGNHGNLALTISKFILTSNNWRDAVLRLMIVNPENSESEKIYKKAEEVLENLRINAEIRVINNQIEQKSFYEIIRVESVNADLIFLGIPEIEENKEIEFVEQTNALMHQIGTVILVKASSYFKELHFGSNAEIYKIKDDSINLVIQENVDIQDIDLPTNEEIASNVNKLNEQLLRLNADIHQKYFHDFFKYQGVVINSVKESIDKTFNILSEKLQQDEGNIDQAEKFLNGIFVRSRKVLYDLQNNMLETQKQMLDSSINTFFTRINNIIKETPKYQFNTYALQDLELEDTDNSSLKRFKQSNQLKVKFSGHPIRYKVKYKKLIESYFPYESDTILLQLFEHWGMIGLQFTVELQKLLKEIKHKFIAIQNEKNKEILIKNIEQYKNETFETIKEIEILNNDSFQSILSFMNKRSSETVSKISENVKELNVNNLVSQINLSKKNQKNQRKKISQIPDLWFNNQNLIYNATIIDLMLLSLESRLKRIFKDTLKSINHIFKKHTIEQLNDLKTYLENYTNRLSENPELKFTPEQDNEQIDRHYFEIQLNEILDNVFKNIKLAISIFPDSIDIMSNESFNEFTSKQYEEIEIINMATARLIDYLIQDELVEPLRKIVDDLPHKLLESYTVKQNIIRLISFSLYDESGNILYQNDNSIEDVISFIKGEQEKITDQLAEIKDLNSQIERQITERLHATIDKLNVYSLSKIAINFKQYITKHESKKRFGFIRKELVNIKKHIGSQIDQLLYRRSEAVLMAQKLRETDDYDYTKVDDLLNLRDEVSVKKEIFEKLPFYYQQLFLRKHNYNQEFWFGRKDELKKAEITIERYRKGFYGGLMILGEPNSGKTFFTQYLISKYLKGSNIISVPPPIAGSIKLSDFKEALQKATYLKGSFDHIFKNIAFNSVIVLEDIELWWEKSEGGFIIIEQICKLIEQYSNKCFFILTLNTISFELINKIKKIENYFLNIIECEPFNAETIKDIILFRHRSSGLKFKIKNRLQQNFKNIEYANLFNKYFNYSNGNIGIALQAWIANIIEYDNRLLSIKIPKAPDISSLDYMETEDLLLIIQFILHRRLSLKRLVRITLQDKDDLKRRINFMKRSGILIENHPETLEINNYMYIHLRNKLETLGML